MTTYLMRVSGWDPGDSYFTVLQVQAFKSHFQTGSLSLYLYLMRVSGWDPGDFCYTVLQVQAFKSRFLTG